MNENGVEETLVINSVDSRDGAVVMKILPRELSFTGLWDESSRTISFSGPIPPNPGDPMPPQQFYKGFLFSTPRNPAPGQDVLWTLTGFVQAADPGTAYLMGGNARRNVFGWFAQITEVA